MRNLFLAAMTAVLGLAASAPAQIFYAPVQSQYVVRQSGRTFYYGGSDERVMAYAARGAQAPYSQSNWTNGTRPGGNSAGHLGVSPTVPIYSDCAPYHDMNDYGWTSSDAVNQANGQVQLYYRRCDSPPVGAPGVWVVPCDGRAAQQVEPPAPAAAATDSKPQGVILIIPARPAAPKAGGKLVASAK